MNFFSGSELTQRANRNLSAAVRCILLISAGGLGAMASSAARAEFCGTYTDKNGNQQGYCVVVGTRPPNDGGGWSGGGMNYWGGGGSTSGEDSDYYEEDRGIDIGDRFAGHDQGCSVKRGNPIIISTGNKIEEELDFQEATERGLMLARTYNHYWTGVGMFGKHWISNMDYMLTFDSTEVDSCFPRPGGGACTIGSKTVIYAWRPSGRTIKFIRNASDGIFYEDKANPVAKIINRGATGFELYNADGSVETYGQSGRIRVVRNPQGNGWIYSYSGTYPTRVTHTSEPARYIEFTWSNGQLTAVRDPAGQYYGFAYHANQFGTGLHRLASVSKPGTPATTITYHYEMSSRPDALTGKSVNGIRYSKFTYDSNGYATGTEHNGVQKHTFSYSQDADGKLTVYETNPLGKRTTHVFEDGKPVSMTGQPSTYCPYTTAVDTEYDANGYPTIKVDAKGNETRFYYNSQGQLTKKIEAYGTALARTRLIAWGSNNRVSSETVGITSATPSGLLRITYSYTSDRRMASVTRTNLSGVGRTEPQVTTYTYSTYPDGMLQSMSVDGPLPGTGDRVTYNYGTSRYLYSIVNSLGHATVYGGYNLRGQPGTITGPNGDKVTFTYDARGRISKRRTYLNGGAQDTVYAYDGDGRLLKVTTPDGVATDYDYYDANRDLLSRIRINSSGMLSGGGTQEQQAYTYDAMGNVTAARVYSVETYTESRFVCRAPIGAPQNQCAEPDFEMVEVTGPVLKRSSFSAYDELGRVRARTGNSGQNVGYTYDLNGNIQTIKDSLGKTTTFYHDALDRLYQTKNALGALTKYGYDALDRVVSVTDPRGKITRYAYDGFGNLLQQTSPDTGSITFEYDQYGRQTKMTRADGTITTFAYDSLGRMVTRTIADKEHRFTYDACANGKGRLCQVWDEYGQLDYTYTPEGLLETQQQRIGGASGFDQGYAYDNLGRLTGISYPGNVSVGYGYSYGRVKTVTATIGGVTHTLASNIQYQPFGPMANLTYGNGLARTRLFDTDGRVTGIHTKNGSTSLQSLAYLYDKNDRITRITNGVDGSLTQNYTYDELGRLLNETYGSSTNYSYYKYDVNGNRTEQGGRRGACHRFLTCIRSRPGAIAFWPPARGTSATMRMAISPAPAAIHTPTTFLGGCTMSGRTE
ncbi:DUF6531 domain-containing protein [Marilutibacter maris]|uniref:DUF6531 domain-containing protein n=1 Tax=Marilutibacter maris TaxID=1605891 RepID=UPI000DA7179D|nr:DUF6531 domain-containing protein [Lysobacter maris]